jgi:prenyltransferase beta subunit
MNLASKIMMKKLTQIFPDHHQLSPEEERQYLRNVRIQLAYQLELESLEEARRSYLLHQLVNIHDVASLREFIAEQELTISSCLQQSGIPSLMILHS